MAIAVELRFRNLEEWSVLEHLIRDQAGRVRPSASGEGTCYVLVERSRKSRGPLVHARIALVGAAAADKVVVDALDTDAYRAAYAAFRVLARRLTPRGRG